MVRAGRAPGHGPRGFGELTRAAGRLNGKETGMRGCGLGILVVFLMGGFAATPAHGQGAAERPNIIFAIADDWGFPHAGAYGYAAARTPTFDRLAKEGMLFTRAFSAAPSCTPSRGSILTGQAPHRLENGGNLWSHLRS